MHVTEGQKGAQPDITYGLFFNQVRINGFITLFYRTSERDEALTKFARGVYQVLVTIF